MSFEAKLKEIKKRCDKAQAAPWFDGLKLNKNDWVFIDHARQDVPMLLEAVKHLIDTLFEFKTCPNCYACEENIERRYKIISKIEKIFEEKK
jgi:hypothetical protein